MKKIVILFSGLIVFAIVLSLLAIPRPALAQDVALVVDIKPASCPSSINLKKKGVTPVAIVGTPDFDVYTVDLSIPIMLEGVQAIAYEFLDSTEPYDPDDNPPSDDVKPGFEDCYDCFAAEDNFNCDTDGDGVDDAYCGDGIMDLILYFPTPELATELDGVSGCITLTLEGANVDGLMIDGNDIASIK